MSSIHGYCEPRFQPIRYAFEANFNEGMELGACVAVTHHGKMVVDLWGGYADVARTRPWQENTLVNVFSTTKVPAALCVHLLIDQGRIDIDLPIQHYWPEFTGGGKDSITMRHVLLHSSGLPGLSKPQSFATMLDWDTMIHILEAEEVWFEPGSLQAYQSITLSWLVGEVIRRITGESPGTFFRNHIASKLDIDFHIGLPRSEHTRVAELEHRLPAEGEEEAATGMRLRVMESFGLGSWTSPQCLEAEILASNGNGNARSIARIGSIFAMGGTLDGVHLLSRETIEECTREHSREVDVCIDSVVARGLGLGRSSEFFEMFSPDTIGWGGYGGSICMIDPNRELVLAYAPNGLEQDIESDARNERLVETLTAMLDTLDD